MNPSTDQLLKWATHHTDGSVTLPPSAWNAVLWMLRTFEKMEGNKHVDAAFGKAARAK